MTKVKKIKLNKLQTIVADRLNSSIKEQNYWIKKQTKELDDSIIQGSSNGYNLRQTIQALETGKTTLTHLIATFEAYVGINYEDYCASIKEDVIATPADLLLNGIKKILENVMKEQK
jgi:hypothetical protein